MAGRYLITGVQLGMLVGIEDLEDRKILTQKIEEKQFIGNSNGDIESDCKIISRHWYAKREQNG